MGFFPRGKSGVLENGFASERIRRHHRHSTYVIICISPGYIPNLNRANRGAVMAEVRTRNTGLTPLSTVR